MYPNIKTHEEVSIKERVIDFGKYKGQKYDDIKSDVSYLEWLVSINKITDEDFKFLTTI